MKTLKIIELHILITQNIKLKEFNTRIMKIIKILEFHMRIKKIMKIKKKKTKRESVKSKTKMNYEK